MDEKNGHELSICACSPEGRSYPRLHQNKCGHWVKEGNSRTLLYPPRDPIQIQFGVLHSALNPQNKKDVDLLGWIQKRATKKVRRPKHPSHKWTQMT